MLFNSYIFVFAFLPICLLGYFALNRFKKFTLARGFLFGMSLWFYGYFNPAYILIIFSSILVNFGAYRLIVATDDRKRRKAFMILGVVFDLGLLGYFKYMDFFIGNINALFKGDLPFLHIALPLGISFFTFQQISFVADAYRGEVPKYDFLSYACFVAYFPQLIAGPIVSHSELVPQLMDESKKKFSWDNFSKGMFLFILGLSKKVLLADVFGGAIPYGFTISEKLNSTTAWLVILGYTIQLYFDFSGYCDMAMGLGKMMNLEIPQNFDSPLRSANIGEFWRRWHMTLGRFFTKYVYIPLGGNRKGLVRTCINTMIVFFLSGLWHGAAWTFVVWGVLHGLMLVIYRIFKKAIDRIPKFLTAILNFLFVCFAFVIFRADSFAQALNIFKNAFAFRFGPVDSIFSDAFRVIEIRKVLAVTHLESRFPDMILAGYYIFALILIWFAKTAKSCADRFRPRVLNCILAMFLLMWCVCSFAGKSVFLYFNF